MIVTIIIIKEIRRMQRKYSRQREAIKEFLAGRTDHPTADTVYTCLREQYPNISLGTVYRNLTLLTEMGEIMKITTGEGADRFDANVQRHHHFICTSCQSVYDLPGMGNIDSVMDTAAASCKGTIDTYRINFYGTCEHCLKTKNPS